MTPGPISMLASVLLVSLAATADEHTLSFVITNPGSESVQTVARVSIPVPAGVLSAAEPGLTIVRGEVRAEAQTCVITRHPDGSVRRVMVSFPAEMAAGSRLEYVAVPTGNDASTARVGEHAEHIETEAFSVRVSNGNVQLLSREGDVLTAVAPFGPDLGGESEARLFVIEAGPHYTWLRYNTGGELWAREVDVEVDRFGRILLTHRLQHAHNGNTWTPDFGFEVSAPGASVPGAVAERSVTHFMAIGADAAFSEHSELVAPIALDGGGVLSVANPLALRQTRGTLSTDASAEGVIIRSNRNEPVEDIETKGLLIQEGQWRISQLLLAPVTAQEMARRCDTPVRTHAHWRLYDAVYQTGPPLAAETPLLMQVAERYVEKMQGMSRNGDDWGTMLTSVRLNHCRYIWEDYFRSGDPRLLDMARDWSENYRNLTIYWGPKKDSYGGGRRGSAWRDRSTLGPGTYIVRFDDSTPGWLTKGFSTFWLAYEETGDPRFREAAEAQARFGADNITCLRREMRSVGAVADYAKLYEYTGDEFHLQQALRLWDEFQQGQMDNLLFTQHGRPEAPGDGLYIGNDEFGYRNPFVKPYMVQYATNSLPYLLKHTSDDQRLRDTILALNNWMATHRQPGGGWGYPHYLTAGMGWNNEYARGIMLAAKIEPKEIYLDAVREILAPQVQLFEHYGEPTSGLNPWEFAEGIDARQREEMYTLASDRDVMRDYVEGQVRFGQSPDNCAYFMVLLRDYLERAPEGSLLDSYPILEKIKQLPTTLDR